VRASISVRLVSSIGVPTTDIYVGMHIVKHKCRHVLIVTYSCVMPRIGRMPQKWQIRGPFWHVRTNSWLKPANGSAPTHGRRNWPGQSDGRRYRAFFRLLERNSRSISVARQPSHRS
jgi:hypothetical protein